MKRTFRAALALSIVASTLSTFSIQTVNAVSANPSAVCSGATCTVTFTFTGDFYTWIVPYTARYTLEVWGSQGGSAGYNGTVLQAGGAGGYAKGNIDLTASNSISIYVGGQGAGLSGTSTLVSPEGGWNGGGAGYIGSSTSDYRGSGGGGATDIRVGGSALTNRVIVAGGGAGGVKYNGYGTNFPGVGGGTSGGDGSTANYGVSQPYHGKGGTQIAGGVRGQNCGGGGNGTTGVGGASEARDGYGGGGGGGGYWGGGGGGCGMGAGGGSGYVGGVLSSTLTAGNATMPNPSGGTMTGRTGDGIARITYDNTISATTFSTSQTSPTNIGTGSTVSYSLVLSQSVSDLTTSDFQFGGTSTCNTPGLSGSTTTYTVTVTNCTEGTLILQLKANSITGTSPGPPSVSSANTVVIDRTAPTISTVVAPANKTYIPSETPTFTVAFSESVTVTGAPRLTLTVGSQTRFANYLSMTDSRTALFRYTVASSATDFDTDGIAVSTSLDLNNGSISDLATNALTNLTFSAPTLTSVLVAQPPAAPTIDSITATSGTLTVYFTPGATRGSAITTYTYATNGTTFKTRTDGTTASPLVITTVSTGATNLANGTGYQIRLRAVSAAGTSDSSTVVNETPTAVAVTGDSTLILTYGSSASTSSYSATGGTSSYTWSLGSVISGVTLSGTVVTASNTLAAGTYSQTVRATDGNSQVGTKSLTITVNKASTSISIALPNSATNAALGGAVTITATVPRAGAVNFRLGGSTISGCGSASAASTTATCSWTPGALGTVSLTAIFTPTDSSNFETSTTSTLTITVVNGVSTVTLSLAGGVTTAPKGQAINIIASIDQAGRVTFLIDGKRVPGCINRLASIGNISCSWRPAVQKPVVITANLNPTNSVYNNSSSRLAVQVTRRTGAR
jgi:hypothetical protein